MLLTPAFSSFGEEKENYFAGRFRAQVGFCAVHEMLGSEVGFEIAKYKSNMERIHINVSWFDNTNPAMVRAKEAAESKPDHWDMAHDCDEMFFLPAMKFWIDRFAGRSDVKILSGHPQPMWGVFDGVFEPSVCVELDANPTALTDLKLAAIDFGQQANQNNVHITRSLKHDPTQDFAEILDPLGTLEIAWLVTFYSPLDPREIYKIAESIEVRDLSIKSDGVNLLIYTYGNPTKNLPAIPDHFKRLAERLGKATPIIVGRHENSEEERNRTNIRSENVWCMELINFGDKQFGATHTYDEAEQLLTKHGC